MRLVEISNEDKSFLTLRGIKFNFVNDYNNVILAFSIIGKSANRRAQLTNDIDNILHDIQILYTFGYSINDPDIIMSKDIYDKLLDVKNKL